MVRKCNDEMFYDNYYQYLITYIVPEVIAFYIASSYFKNVMCNATFIEHYNSAIDVFNIDSEGDYEKIKTEVIKLLKINY